jgi:hypothetical protein
MIENQQIMQPQQKEEQVLSKDDFFRRAKLERRSKISKFFSDWKEKEEKLSTNSGEKRKVSKLQRPDWIHDHTLVLMPEDLFSSNDKTYSVEENLIRLIREFNNNSDKSQKQLITSVILNGNAWQDPLHWGRPNPEINWIKSTTTATENKKDDDEYYRVTKIFMKL